MSDDEHLPATKGELRDFVTNSDLIAVRNDIITALKEMIRPIELTLAQHSAVLADIRGYMKNNLVTRDEFRSRMDGFERNLDTRAERLKKLESRPN